MKCFNHVFNSKFNNTISGKHIGIQYQPLTYNKPRMSNSAPITLNAISDVEGLQRAYVRDNGIHMYIYMYIYIYIYIY